MLTSPMKVVDMGRDPDDLYGIEHLPNIINGNWERSFKSRFIDRERTKVCLSEIIELRHNLAHGRKYHLVRRQDLIRFLQNARNLLRAVGSPEADKFEEDCNSLSNGGSLWNSSIGGYLPPYDEIYDEFIGRPGEIESLYGWFADNRKPIVVSGYGGAGKSALAFKFAKEIQEASPPGYQAVVWLTAKRTEFVEGSARDHMPDFSDVRSFCNRVWIALYGVSIENNDTDKLIQELDDTPCLIVIDDLDTLMGDRDRDTMDFLLHDLRASKNSKILYNSRHQIPGLGSIEVQGFEGDDLSEFMRMRASEYRINSEECVNRASAIRSVTGGYPLFVDDLMRYSAFVGIENAITDWGKKKGDAAREYALTRQLQSLAGVSGDVLMVAAVSNRPLSLVEVSRVAGITDDDAENGIRDLIRWRLLHDTINNNNVPVFSMNANTRRLTMQTFGDMTRLRGMKVSFSNLTGDRVPAARSKAIASAITAAKETLKRDGVVAAADQLKGNMTGDLVNEPDLHGVLGWIYSHSETHTDVAREHFEAAHRFGARKPDSYYHWARMEQRIAERRIGAESTRDLLRLWQRASKVAEIGLERCEYTDSLCQKAGYFKSREAGVYDELNEHIIAQGAYQIAAEWYKKALNSPSSSDEKVPRYLLHRGLVFAYAGLDDLDNLAKSLTDWRNVASGDPDFRQNFRQEANQLQRRFPDLSRRLPWLQRDSAP